MIVAASSGMLECTLNPKEIIQSTLQRDRQFHKTGSGNAALAPFVFLNLLKGYRQTSPKLRSPHSNGEPSPLRADSAAEYVGVQN
jgi:hypothetical protein